LKGLNTDEPNAYMLEGGLWTYMEPYHSCDRRSAVLSTSVT